MAKPKKCKHCAHPIIEVNFVMGRQWMHFDERASFPTVQKGTLWWSCKTFVAEPEN